MDQLKNTENAEVLAALTHLAEIAGCDDLAQFAARMTDAADDPDEYAARFDAMANHSSLCPTCRACGVSFRRDD